MKVLMIGPARSVNGGISAVVNNYYKAGLDKKIELKYIGTMEDGSKFHKLSVAVGSIFKFIWNVCNYDIVHINMASDMSLYRKIPFIYLTKLFHKKLVIHQHGGNFKEFYYQQCGKRKQEFIKKTLEKADVFLVVADYLGDIFGQIISKDKIISLPNAIEVHAKIEEKSSNDKEKLFAGIENIIKEQEETGKSNNNLEEDESISFISVSCEYSNSDTEKTNKNDSFDDQ